LLIAECNEVMNKQLVIESKCNDGWQFVFRKDKERPIEMLKRHKTLGSLSNWQVARNFCLKGLVSYEKLAAHFGISEWEFHFSK
jgi:hypothetical protein